MHPIAFEIAGFPVGSYALLALIALAAGCALATTLAGRRSLDQLRFLEITLWAFLIALFGAKVFGLAVDYRAGVPWQGLMPVLRMAGHWYAGIITGCVFFAIAFRRAGIPPLVGLDALAPGIALAHGLGRIGCFLVGCCWGTACDQPWAVTFVSEQAHALSHVPLGIPLHPVQLYEAVAEFVVAGGLVLLHARSVTKPGLTAAAYVLAYGVVRLVLEGVRADPRGDWFGVSPSRVLAAVAILVGGIAVARILRRDSRRVAA